LLIFQSFQYRRPVDWLRLEVQSMAGIRRRQPKIGLMQRISVPNTIRKRGNDSQLPRLKAKPSKLNIGLT
jgi:hypothetical protein